MGFNPKTQQKIKIPAKTVVKFRVAKAYGTTLWAKLCFDFVAIVSQWQSVSEDWALALARETVIYPLTDQPEVTEELVVTASDDWDLSRLVYWLVAKFRGGSRRVRE